VVVEQGEAPPVPGGYFHQQLSSSGIWHIVHGLGYRPNVTAKDSIGDIIEPADITHAAGLNSTDLLFDRPVSGTAVAS
jgi:hypothetical protein